MTLDPEIRVKVNDEFNAIWNSLVADINSPLKTLRMTRKAVNQGSILGAITTITNADKETHKDGVLPSNLSSSHLPSAALIPGSPSVGASVGTSTSGPRLDTAATLIKPLTSLASAS